MNTTIKHLAIFLVITTAIIGLQKVNAQIDKGFHHGIRLGIGESIVDFQDKSGENTLLMYTGGLSTNYQFNRFIGLSADFLITARGGRRDGYYTDNSLIGKKDFYFTDTYRLNYVDIPLMAKLSLPIGSGFAFRAYTGPSLNFLFSGYETREYEDPNYDENNGYKSRELKKLNVADGGWVFGVGTDVLTGDGGAFVLDLRATLGTQTAGTIQSTSVINNSYMISFAYLF
ncbi:MAG: PorT family protein [Bacteroidetes bacterium]|nr:PorT family protein [Bacteroidota bacterium]